MTYAAQRLAELEALSRQRPLTDAEQREAMMRARQERNNRARRMKYFLEPDYRDRHIQRARQYRAQRTEARA